MQSSEKSGKYSLGILILPLPFFATETRKMSFPKSTRTYHNKYQISEQQLISIYAHIKYLFDNQSLSIGRCLMFFLSKEIITLGSPNIGKEKKEGKENPMYHHTAPPSSSSFNLQIPHISSLVSDLLFVLLSFSLRRLQQCESSNTSQSHIPSLHHRSSTSELRGGGRSSGRSLLDWSSSR